MSFLYKHYKKSLKNVIKGALANVLGRVS